MDGFESKYPHSGSTISVKSCRNCTCKTYMLSFHIWFAINLKRFYLYHNLHRWTWYYNFTNDMVEDGLRSNIIAQQTYAITFDIKVMLFV